MGRRRVHLWVSNLPEFYGNYFVKSAWAIESDPVEVITNLKPPYEPLCKHIMELLTRLSMVSKVLIFEIDAGTALV